MTTKTLASEYLTVKGSMWSSKSMLQIIRSKALANIAVSTTDSDYPSTSNSSPKGELSSQQSITDTYIYLYIHIYTFIYIALANIAVSTTDSAYPSTSNSSPKGELSSE